MLGQTSPRVTDCLNKAAEARLLHDAETDPDKRLTCRHIEHAWYYLANGYEFMDQLDVLMTSKPSRGRRDADSR
jgi:hypothetical protein